MKTLIVVVLLSSSASACKPGQTAYEGVCVDDLKPIVEAAPEVKPSDEKPSRHPEPAWQRGEFHVSDGSEERQKAQKHDQEIDEANAQGKKAAGIEK